MIDRIIQLRKTVRPADLGIGELLREWSMLARCHLLQVNSRCGPKHAERHGPHRGVERSSCRYVVISHVRDRPYCTTAENGVSRKSRGLNFDRTSRR